MPVNAGDLWTDEFLEDTDPHTTPEMQFVGVLGEVFYLSAREQDCEYSIEVQALKGRWDAVAEGTLKAGELVVVQITFFMPRCRVVVTPAVADVHVGIAAYGYPAVYSRA